MGRTEPSSDRIGYFTRLPSAAWRALFARPGSRRSGRA